ncbi:putative transcription factor bZIP family [Lupinus albus]|uniref:Putative transcription factor bZIP family n=1 Tax=Lupinus albus TaxID=3870 RepID=A0A6A4Q0H9_LUPAL|nr:putative transcription factor bZIP family [Lupinus albus]
MNFNGDDMNGKPPPNVNLMRQSTIYSLTFDELQNTMGGFGKDFGSMNMDELLKNIWTAEETQALASSAASGGGSGGGGGDGHNPGNLQRQGSITLPRTLSQKKVDEVWRDLIKDGSGNVGSSMPQSQPTLGEITLEEFLVRAGVVREDMPQPQQIGRPNNNSWFGDLSRSNNNNGEMLLGFQQTNTNNGNSSNNRILEGNNLVPKHPPPFSLNSNHSQQQAQQHQHLPPLFPIPANVAFTAPPPMHMLNNSLLTSSGKRGGIIGVPEHSMNGTLVQSSVLQGTGMVGLAAANAIAPGASQASAISPDVIANNDVDRSPLLPVPCVINRGRKCSAVEKVVERRQRRMIKNRESAARSRARKQAYTFELEAEIEKLKELNKELQRKQAENMKMPKNQDSDSAYCRGISKRQCLRRTLTGPW